MSYEKEQPITPHTIVTNLLNHKITETEAVAQIEYCIQRAMKDAAPINKQDIKEIKDYAADLIYCRYDISKHGNAELINEEIRNALKRLGYGSKLSEVPHKYMEQIKETLFDYV